MTKKITLVAIVVLVLFGVFAMSMRRAHMMGGAGVQLDLVAVSSDGAQIPLPTDFSSITSELPKNITAQKSDNLVVSLALNPYPPTAGQPADFDFTLTDINGLAINDASISLDLTMPEMWMPPNQLAMEFMSDGKYHATGFFTMRGLWRIEVIIMRGDVKQSVFFDVGL